MVFCFKGKIFLIGKINFSYKTDEDKLLINYLLMEKDRQRFESKINKTDDCWLWIESINERYGRFRFEGKLILAHRFSYLLNGDVIPKGHVLRHKCRNRKCVNPQHLESGTQAENNRDQIRDGTSARGTKHHKNKLTETQVREIRLSNKSQKEIAKEYGVAKETISSILNKRSWYWLEELCQFCQEELCQFCQEEL